MLTLATFQLYRSVSTQIYSEKVIVHMHIDITPNRQSLPCFLISCNSVATHRAPKKNFKTILERHKECHVLLVFSKCTSQ